MPIPRMLIHGFVWLTAEIVLGWIGLDDLADYGEFLQGYQTFTGLPIVAETFFWR